MAFPFSRYFQGGLWKENKFYGGILMTTLERFVTMLSISLIIAGMIGIHYYMGIGSAVVFGLGVACMTLTINIENIKKDFLEIEA
jgi:hypothetical protein